MWSGASASVLLLAVLLARGWRGDAWTAAAVILFLTCVVACAWAGAIGERSSGDVRREVERLVAQRRATAGGASNRPRREQRTCTNTARDIGEGIA
jgi:hypothetical protein